MSLFRLEDGDRVQTHPYMYENTNALVLIKCRYSDYVHTHYSQVFSKCTKSTAGLFSSFPLMPLMNLSLPNNSSDRQVRRAKTLQTRSLKTLTHTVQVHTPAHM